MGWSMMKSRVSIGLTSGLIGLLIAGCGSQPVAAPVKATTSGPVASSTVHKPVSLAPGCAAGGSVDVIGGPLHEGYPTVAASVGLPAAVVLQVANDNGGRVQAASALIHEPGVLTTSGNVRILASASLDMPTAAATRSTLTFTPPTAGWYPVLVHAVHSVSDACAKRAMAAGAKSTDTVEDSLVGWVEAR